MNDADAVEALSALGLSTYAARTFVGLQKLGVASASDVAGVADVPRSQVYGATDELESLGLVDVRDGSPRRYRPVPVREARDLLYERLRATGDEAFEYLESVRGQRADDEEGHDAIWTTEGRANVAARVSSLVDGADGRVLFATGDPSLFDGAVADALAAADERGVTVTLVSADPAVREAGRAAGLSVKRVPDDAAPELSIGRVLVADDDTVLFSVLPRADVAATDAESAFWTEGTGFAVLLARLIGEQFGV
ncbi:TrmB family transcriptional regulator [Halosegnis marinus]|uniref:TrmB family transcriptional regulator n=1 Tax=Halosegnis marinus TaxID=3034023 RepID=A0ABD5ZN21_9EURY|nr:helix-turn-helix domain-containing protein [Halosegnis sp. DT85]